MIRKLKRKLKKQYCDLLNLYYGRIDYDFDNKPKRWNLINEIIIKKNYNNYLEIGCFNDDCFSKINIVNKVGVDPLKGGTIRKTSDQFFEINSNKFDIIFIDGLHIYEQVKKDILNSLKFLNKDGVILCHDSLPTEYTEQTVPSMSGIWVGNVWKAIAEIRNFENLDVCVCTIDHGVSVIKVRENSNPPKHLDLNFKRLNYKFYYKNHKWLMNTKEYDDSIRFAVHK